MKVIYLIRHAEALKNKNIIFKENFDEQEKNEKLPLSVIGEQEALNTAKKYFEKGIDQVWTSTYERAISTAKYIATLNNVNINISKKFNERKLGNTDGVKEEFWLTQLYDENAKTENGESQKEVRIRMLDGINDILNNMDDNSTSVIISHATSITFLLMNWCELISAQLDGKKRHLKYKNADILNGSFGYADIFKLSFNKNQLIYIEKI